MSKVTCVVCGKEVTEQLGLDAVCSVCWLDAITPGPEQEMIVCTCCGDLVPAFEDYDVCGMCFMGLEHEEELYMNVGSRLEHDDPYTIDEDFDDLPF